MLSIHRSKGMQYYSLSCVILLQRTTHSRKIIQSEEAERVFHACMSSFSEPPCEQLPQKEKVCKIIFWLYLYSQLSCLRNDEVITLTDSEDDTDSVVVIGSDTSEEPTESIQFTNTIILLRIFYSV